MCVVSRIECNPLNDPLHSRAIPMTVPQIDFTWHRDANGYRLIPEKPLPARRPGQSRMDQLLAMKSGDLKGARVVGKGGPLKPYRPLDKFPDLFKMFVK